MSLLNIFQNYFCLFVNFTFFFSLFYFNYFRFFVGCNIKSAIWNILNCSRPLGLKIFLHASDNSSFKTTSEFLNIVLIVINLLWGFIIINDRHSLRFLQNVYYCPALLHLLQKLFIELYSIYHKKRFNTEIASSFV